MLLRCVQGAARERRRKTMEEEGVKPAAGAFTPRNLETLSIKELEEYIPVLEAEINRVRRDIDEKRTHMDSAQSLFRSK